MKENYTYVNGGNVVIIDSMKEGPEVRPYVDNIDEVLAAEKLIERIESDLEYFNDRPKYTPKNAFERAKDGFKMQGLLGAFIFVVFAIAFLIAVCMNSGISLTPLLPIGIICGLFPIIGAGWGFFTYKKAKVNDEEIKNKIILLEQELENQKSLYLELINDKKKEKEAEMVHGKTKKVKTKKMSKNYLQNVEIYNNASCLAVTHERKYLKLFEAGTLRESLDEEYNRITINLIEEHIKGVSDSKEKAKEFKKRFGKTPKI
jgi:hypothetical protein